MAWLEQDKITGKWSIRWREDGKLRFLATGTRNKSVARRIEKEITRDRGRERPVENSLTLSELHRKRIEYLTIHGSPNTVDREAMAYKAFRAFLKEDLRSNPTLAMFDDYTVHRKASGLSDNTVNGDLKHLQAMLNWGAKRDYCQPVIIPKLKLNVTDAVILTEADIENFFQAIDDLKPTCPKRLAYLGDDFWRDYWQMIFELYFQTGARRDEIANLQWTDINYQMSEIAFKKTKGRRDRTVPISPELLKKMERFKVAGFLKVCLHSGNRNYNVYKRYALAAGIRDPQKLKLHTVRHTVASFMDQGGSSMETIRGLLGHSKINMTAVYIHPNREQCRKALNSLPWVQRGQ